MTKTLRELRRQSKMTQVECANFLGIPIRRCFSFCKLPKMNILKAIYLRGQNNECRERNKYQFKTGN